MNDINGKVEESSHESREEARRRRRGEGYAEGDQSEDHDLAQGVRALLEEGGESVAMFLATLTDRGAAQRILKTIKKETGRRAPIVVPAKSLAAIVADTKAALLGSGIELSTFMPDIERFPRNAKAKTKYEVVLLSYDRIVTDREVTEAMAAQNAVRCHEAFAAFIAGPLRPGVWVSHGVGTSVLDEAIQHDEVVRPKKKATLLYEITGKVNLLNIVGLGPSWQPGTTLVGFRDLTPPPKSPPATDAPAEPAGK